MEYEIYVVYDAAKEYYNQPICATNDADAMRTFAHEAYRSESLMNTHPQDFILYKVGTFYSLTGEIVASKPERVCTGTDFVKGIRKKGVK